MHYMVSFLSQILTIVTQILARMVQYAKTWLVTLSANAFLVSLVDFVMWTSMTVTLIHVTTVELAKMRLMDLCASARTDSQESNVRLVSNGYKQNSVCLSSSHDFPVSDIDDCYPNPCKNDAMCQDLVDDFECKCPPGFTGRLCDVDINDCDPNPCENGGTCKDEVDGLVCQCQDGFTGVQCETGKQLSSRI